MRVALQWPQPAKEVLALGGTGRHEVFLLQDRESRYACRASRRVGRVGEEHHAATDRGDRGDHLVRGVHPAEGRVAAGEALAADHDVGNDAPVVHAELSPGPAEAGHHLVGDEQDVVRVTDRPHVGPPVVRWQQGARGGSDHRFGDHRRDRVRALGFDDLLEALGIGDRHLWEVHEDMLEARPPRGVSADSQRGQRHSVVGGLPTDDLPAFRLSPGHEVVDGQSDGRVDGLGPTADQAHPVQPGRQPTLPENLDEGDPLLGDPWRDDVGDPLCGMGDGLGHLGAPVADVDGNRPAAGVDDLPASGEEERAALGALDDRGSLGGRHERECGSPAVVDARSLPDEAAWRGCHRPPVPLVMRTLDNRAPDICTRRPSGHHPRG